MKIICFHSENMKTVLANLYYILQYFSQILLFYQEYKLLLLYEKTSLLSVTKFVSLTFRYCVKDDINVSLLFLTKIVPEN